MLNINLIYDELPEGKRQEEITFIRRTAVRGIIYDRDRLLMVQTRLGDYKFPGGGVQENETHEEALKRGDCRGDRLHRCDDLLLFRHRV